MKHIRKRGCPREYAQWCKAVRRTEKEAFGEIPRDQKGILLEALVAEQGSLCAYTMKRISPMLAHVEHIKPQSAFADPKNGADLSFDNLVACFPREGMKAKYRYGAQEKDNWWADEGKLFVSPLDPSCEGRFRYLRNGGVSGTGAAAEKTIAVLGLAHPTLCEDRSRVLEEFIFGPSGRDPLSAAGATAAVDAVCRREASGNFREFCVAIRDGLREHLRYLEKLAQKKKALRRNR